MSNCIRCHRLIEEGKLCRKYKELLNAEAKPKTTKESKKVQTQKWSTQGRSKER